MLGGKNDPVAQSFSLLAVNPSLSRNITLQTLWYADVPEAAAEIHMNQHRHAVTLI